MSNSINGNIHSHKLKFGSEYIDCSIQFDDRDRLKIIVYPDQTVLIKAPSNRSLSQVLDKVKKRAAWILKQIHYFEQFMPRLPERSYLSGESFYYLGRQYRLKVIKDDTETVKLIGRFLRVHTPDKNDTEHIKTLIDKWYREHAQKTLSKRLGICHESVQRYNIKLPQFKLRTMKRRWGSCNGSGNILLNTKLIMAPLRCIDYVITHELCHLKYPSHSQNFYKLLSRIMPDWKIRKERLEKVLI